MKTIKFNEKELLVWKTIYPNNGHLAILLVKNEENLCKENIHHLREYRLSVNFDDYLGKNKKELFLLKTYSENEKIAKFLITNGYLKKTGNIRTQVFPTHIIEYPEVEMTEKFKQCIFKL